MADEPTSTATEPEGTDTASTEAPEETPDQFDTEQFYTYEWLRSHIERGPDGKLDDFVRTDAALRNIAMAGHYRDNLKQRFGGKISFAAYSVGTLLGGRGVMEIGGLAVNPGGTKEIAWLPEDPDRANARRPSAPGPGRALQ
jgi:hypothetical protein